MLSAIVEQMVIPPPLSFCPSGVAGNHEYYTGDVDNWIAELPKLGVTPLINSRVCLLGRGGRGGEGGEEGECEGGMYLAGIEDITTRTWGM